MKVLVTGVTGQLGYDVVRELKKRKIRFVAPTRKEMDISDRIQVEKYINDNLPDVIVHCAAYTLVDAAEDNEELCNQVNVSATKNIVDICKDKGIKLVFISTDYVFDGTGEEPWKIDAVKRPLNIYGISKSNAEDIIMDELEKYFILRVSWAFGINGNNFVKTMIRLGQEKDQISVVSDQIGSPTYTVDLAKLIVDMIGTDKFGVYHVTNENYCSFYEFANEILKLKNITCKVNPIASSEYATKTKRPLNSRLDKSALIENGFELLPSWQDGLRRYLLELDHQ